MQAWSRPVSSADSGQVLAGQFGRQDHGPAVSHHASGWESDEWPWQHGFADWWHSKYVGCKDHRVESEYGSDWRSSGPGSRVSSAKYQRKWWFWNNSDYNYHNEYRRGRWRWRRPCERMEGQTCQVEGIERVGEEASWGEGKSTFAGEEHGSKSWLSKGYLCSS